MKRAIIFVITLQMCITQITAPTCGKSPVVIQSTITPCTSQAGWDYLHGDRLSFTSQMLQSRCLEACHYTPDCSQAAHLDYYGVYACMLLNGTTPGSTQPSYVTDYSKCIIMVIKRNETTN